MNSGNLNLVILNSTWASKRLVFQCVAEPRARQHCHGIPLEFCTALAAEFHARLIFKAATRASGVLFHRGAAFTAEF